MSRILDLKKSVYELVTENPELAELMAALGFTEITKKAALNTVGRMMTIPKGAEIKDIDLRYVVSILQKAGYSLVGLPDGFRPYEHKDADELSQAPAQDSSNQNNSGVTEREAKLAGYVKRLSEGDDLEKVREDFVKNFKDVDAAEIAKAEQTLISSGVPVTDVQRLCDVHSALFHGATRTEQIANAEKAVQVSLQNQNKKPDMEKKPAPLHRQDGADEKYDRLCKTEGHPLQILRLENDAISSQLKKLRAALKSGEDVPAQLDRTRQIALHYAKKGDLLYPLLKNKYEFSGPSDVMWSVDDEIRDDLKVLAEDIQRDPSMIRDKAWNSRMDAALTRAEEMVYKEENILFPLCAKLFSEEEWKQIARDHQDYELCLIDKAPAWQEAVSEDKVLTAASYNGQKSGEELAAANGTGAEGSEQEIVFGSGHMNRDQLEAMLNTIPMEITFIDDQNINRYFNDNGEPKLFKRPLMALDREVFSCHPPKIEPMVRMILQEFRDGKEDSVEVWNSRAGEPVLIRYMAVRDKEGNYLGTMELVQRMGSAKKHFAEEESGK
ncbi:MAG: DUF438 domain-containing protein [Eubacterium sp.]